MNHLPVSLLERYAAGSDAAWTVETHLESCATCRRVLGEIVERADPGLTARLQRVEAWLAVEVGRNAQAPGARHRPRRRVQSWTAPAMLPRVLMTILVVAAAVGLDLADAAAGSRFPSLVLLVAPVAPLAGVAAAWSRRLDPAYEVVAATPRAGLDLVLRRTFAVLVVVIPALAVGGAAVDVSPATWLLPCLAFTAGALALGELIGLRQAASGLALAWAATVAAPSLTLERTPAVLDSAGRPVWLAVLVVLAALLMVRRRSYTRPADLR